MAAVVKFGSINAVLMNGRWACDNQKILDTLEAKLQRDQTQLSGSDPNPEYTLAKLAADAFGGEVVKFDKPAFDPAVVY